MLYLLCMLEVQSDSCASCHVFSGYHLFQTLSQRSRKAEVHTWQASSAYQQHVLPCRAASWPSWRTAHSMVSKFFFLRDTVNTHQVQRQSHPPVIHDFGSGFQRGPHRATGRTPHMDELGTTCEFCFRPTSSETALLSQDWRPSGPLPPRGGFARTG